jgi:hypothetical protein
MLKFHWSIGLGRLGELGGEMLYGVAANSECAVKADILSTPKAQPSRPVADHRVRFDQQMRQVVGKMAESA